MADGVREPIQTYLTGEERAELDRVARELGVSRSEVLRRGIEALGRVRRDSALRDLVHEGAVTPPSAGPGSAPPSAPAGPPPSIPVAPLSELLAELDRDRADR